MTENKEYSWKPKNVLLSHIKRQLVDREHVVIVDKSLYDWFINMSDKQMITLMKGLIFADYKELNRKLLCPEPNPDEITDHVLFFLWFVAHQIAYLDPDENAIVLSWPLGDAATPDQARLIDERIDKSRDLVGVAIWDLMKTTEAGQKIKRDIEDDMGEECEIRSIFQIPQVKQAEKNPKPNNKSIFGTMQPRDLEN